MTGTEVIHHNGNSEPLDLTGDAHTVYVPVK